MDYNFEYLAVRYEAPKRSHLSHLTTNDTSISSENETASESEPKNPQGSDKEVDSPEQ